MSENEAVEIANDLFSRSQLDPCRFESVKFTSRSMISSPTTIGDEWIVVFVFHEDDETGYSGARAIVVVDDANGHAELMETL